jgi:hypothetical protein
MSTKPSLTPKEFRAKHRFSARTWRRMKDANDLPRLTWLTARKPIITPENEQAWLDARTDPPRDDESSPFGDAS